MFEYTEPHVASEGESRASFSCIHTLEALILLYNLGYKVELASIRNKLSLDSSQFKQTFDEETLCEPVNVIVNEGENPVLSYHAYSTGTLRCLTMGQ